MRFETEITEALEDYLEAIEVIIAKNGAVRVKEIAAELGVTNPSVTVALQGLKKHGLINYEPYGEITLTSSGSEHAARISEKHRLLKTFFTSVLGVEESAADETACRMEHVIPREVFVKLVQFIKFIHRDTAKTDLWLEEFRTFSANEPSDPFCEGCVDSYLDGTGFGEEEE